MITINNNTLQVAGEAAEKLAEEAASQGKILFAIEAASAVVSLGAAIAISTMEIITTRKKMKSEKEESVKDAPAEE